MESRALLLPVIAYAAVGLVLSLFVHLLSFEGVALGGNVLFFALHVGIFPLWFIVMPLSARRNGGWSWQRNQKQDWKKILAGCPTWMKYMTYGFFAYAIVNFAIFFIGTAVAPKPIPTHGVPPVSVWHGFSGHWMAFYSAGLAVATSLYRRGWAPTRCPNGHTVGIDDRFCSTCGAAITPQFA